jgi:hypothetical protein
MDDDISIDVFINPLAFLEVDQPWASLGEREPTPQDIFNFLCTPGVPADVRSLTGRYKEISREESRLFVAPNDQRILEKLIWPLRHAKASYILGNFLSTIALCGVVTEMLAIFIFELAQIEGIEIKNENGDEISGQAFEKMGQKNRVRTLWNSGVINEKVKSNYDLVRTSRRKYLHLWSQDHDILSRDSVAVFNATVLIVVNAFGLGIENGALSVKPSVISYLKKTGQSDEGNDGI